MAGMHFDVVGTGRPAFAFLPGLFGRGRNWTQIAQGLAAQGYASVLFDLPNHGESPWTTRFSYPELAQTVAVEIEHRLGSPSDLVLVGHSLGGKVAMLTALAEPGLLAGLAVVDIAAGTSHQVQNFGGLVEAMRGLDLSSLSSRADADAALAVKVPDQQVRQFLLTNLRNRPNWHWQPNLELLGDSLTEIGEWPSPAPGAVYPGPTLWLVGENSAYCGEADAAAMAALFPAVTTVVVSGAGHWVHADAPGIVVAELARLRERASADRH